jgi:hypothetical protein
LWRKEKSFTTRNRTKYHIINCHSPQKTNKTTKPKC